MIPSETCETGHTVGTYSLGNLLVVYDIKRQVYGACSEHEERMLISGETHLSDGTITDDYTFNSLHISSDSE